MAIENRMKIDPLISSSNVLPPRDILNISLLLNNSREDYLLAIAIELNITTFQSLILIVGHVFLNRVSGVRVAPGVPRNE